MLLDPPLDPELPNPEVASVYRLRHAPSGRARGVPARAQPGRRAAPRPEPGQPVPPGQRRRLRGPARPDRPPRSRARRGRGRARASASQLPHAGLQADPRQGGVLGDAAADGVRRQPAERAAEDRRRHPRPARFSHPAEVAERSSSLAATPRRSTRARGEPRATARAGRPARRAGARQRWRGHDLGRRLQLSQLALRAVEVALRGQELGAQRPPARRGRLRAPIAGHCRNLLRGGERRLEPGEATAQLEHQRQRRDAGDQRDETDHLQEVHLPASMLTHAPGAPGPVAEHAPCRSRSAAGTGRSGGCRGSRSGCRRAPRTPSGVRCGDAFDRGSCGCARVDDDDACRRRAGEPGADQQAVAGYRLGCMLVSSTTKRRSGSRQRTHGCRLGELRTFTSTFVGHGSIAVHVYRSDCAIAGRPPARCARPCRAAERRVRPLRHPVRHLRPARGADRRADRHSHGAAHPGLAEARRRRQQRRVGHLRRCRSRATRRSRKSTPGSAEHEIIILWTDYFKPEHLEKHANLHDVVWKTCKLTSTVKQQINMDAAQQLLAGDAADRRDLLGHQGRQDQAPALEPGPGRRRARLPDG